MVDRSGGLFDAARCHEEIGTVESDLIDCRRLVELKAAIGHLGERCHGRVKIGTSRDSFACGRGYGHEVSILIELIGCVRGEQPGSKVSMMIMRPPQHGQGCESAGG
jgi:hypothetical protein